MKHDNQRYGTFSSSQVYKLIKTGKGKNDVFSVPGFKYIKQVSQEIKLGRSINKEHNARATSYGTYMETVAFGLLPLEYQLVSQERYFHSTIPNYSGAPDLIKGENTLGDVKSPYSLEVFCDKIEALKNIDIYKEEYPEDYWQNLSNCILLRANGFDITHFEAAIFCPFLDEWEAIKESLNSYTGDMNKIAFLHFASPEELPYLIRGGKYNNLNIVNFKVNEDDINYLTERIKLANKHLDDLTK